MTPLSARLAQGPLRIGVFGDSMADGLYTGLYRDLRDEPTITVTRFSEVSTGLSRYDYVDIQAKTQRQIEATPVDVAVVLFGTNGRPGHQPGWRDPRLRHRGLEGRLCDPYRQSGGHAAQPRRGGLLGRPAAHEERPVRRPDGADQRLWSRRG
ncbi:MAG: DUF459 domain-containing protein [Brevundimonas sp.]|nr:DUF459 domain-containing protein [Brevundimonas sp.]